MNLRKRIEKIEAETAIKKEDNVQRMKDFIQGVSDEALDLLIEYAQGKKASLSKAELKEKYNRVVAALKPDELKLFKIWEGLTDDDFDTLLKLQESDNAA